MNKADYVPESQILRGALWNKFESSAPGDFDYRKYLANSIIDAADGFVIAINSHQIPHTILDDDPPWIVVKTVFPVGNLQMTLDRESLEIVRTEHEYRPIIHKASGAEVETTPFIDGRHTEISAVLYSAVGPCTSTQALGEDFILVHNSQARNPLPPSFLPRGHELTLVDKGDYYLPSWINYRACRS